METAGATELFWAADDCRGFFFNFPFSIVSGVKLLAIVIVTSFQQQTIITLVYHQKTGHSTRWADGTGWETTTRVSWRSWFFLGNFENITDIFLGIVCHVIWYLRWFSHVLAFICKPLQNVMVKRHISKGANKETFEMWFLEMRF